MILEGYKILVTGASRGIGYGIAKVLLEKGAYLYLTSKNSVNLNNAVKNLEKETSNKGKIIAYKAFDLSVPGNAYKLAEEAISTLKGIDGVVYVPPPPPAGRFEDLTMEDWRKSAEMLVFSPIELVRGTLNAMKESALHGNSPSYLFVTSIAAWEPDPIITTSSVLRISLHGLVQTLARDLGEYGIRVNALVPGYILTDRLRSLAEKRMPNKPSEYLDSIASRIPLGRIGDPTDMGYLAAFLLSREASYINGAIIPVDGGLHKKTI